MFGRRPRIPSLKMSMCWNNAMTVMPIFCRAMSESYQLICHAICHLSIKMARWVLACSLYGYTCLSYYHYLIIIVTKLSSVYMVSSLHCFPHKKTLPIFIQTILYDYYTAGHFKKHDDLIWYIQAKCNLYRIFVERVVNDWNCACQVQGTAKKRTTTKTPIS